MTAQSRAHLAALPIPSCHMGLRAPSPHLQLLTTLHGPLTNSVAIGLVFLVDAVPWGQSPCLILLFPTQHLTQCDT